MSGKLDEHGSTPAGEKKAELRLEQLASPSPAPEEYNRVVVNAKLLLVNMRSSHFEIEPAYFRLRADDVSKDVDRALVHSYDCDASRLIFDAEEGTVSADFEWSLRVVTHEKKQMLRLSCNYLVMYEDLVGCGDLAAKTFLLRVGTFASYPYFRAFAAQISWASAAQLPTLPVMTAKNVPNVFGALLPEQEKKKSGKQLAATRVKKKG